MLLDLQFPRTLDAWVARWLPQRGATVEGWLFEGPAARRAAERRLLAAGVVARFHSAYKPLVHHFLEQVDTAGLERVAVRYPVHPHAAPRRFALEAYPLVEMIGSASLSMQPLPTEDALPVYEVELHWLDGRHRSDTVVAPNRVHTDHLGETLLSPTAWLQGERVESEYEAVFRSAMQCLQRHPWPDTEPYFERLDIRVDLPGIALVAPAESGWINSHEALHEDLYFSLLEVFQARSGRPAGDRRLQPGQIVPDVRPGDGTVRLRIGLGPYACLAPQPATGKHVALAQAEAPITPERVASELDGIAGHRFEVSSVEGRVVRGVYRAGPGPAVLISGAQHANETTGVVGALRAAQTL
ncbi:MAG: hypothetical protein Q7T55_00840, partial [Solirubrobacteraceae bacterium]|nr:hypothetical protein [Solirubrobacteraceae bacterium]